MVEPPGKTTGLAAEALREPTTQNAGHAALFERVTGRIYRYFLKHVWNPAEAEELAQRTLVELERTLRDRSYDPARSFNAWMWLKAHTVFAQWCRERGKRADALPGPDDASAPRAASHQDAVDDRLDAAAVLREVQRRLGPESYEVFVLYYEGGLSQAEVAEAVDRDRKTVASRLREAHELISSLLDRRTS